MKMPNFLVIGAAKAGTTSLCYYLEQHPQIYMSPIKEPFFFSFAGEELNFQGPGDRAVYQPAVTNLENYQTLFQSVADELAIGEGSTLYLYTPKAIEQIKKYVPDAKLIVVLRNPIDRAFSNFLHKVRDHLEPISDFQLAYREEKNRMLKGWSPSWHYINMGFYYQQIKPYFEQFGSKQIKVYLYEDFKHHLPDLLVDIFKFLQVDPNFMPDINTRLNEGAGVPKNKFIYQLLSKNNPIFSACKSLIPQPFHQSMIHTIQTVRKQNMVQPQLSPQARNELKEIYREDILQLQTLIQRDLSHWLA